jgi:polyisoprenoid-binding protein YceI
VVQITGVTRPLTLHAALASQSLDLTEHSEIAEFIAHGSLSRSEFKMTRDKVFILDKVNIIIKARPKLPQAFDAR